MRMYLLSHGVTLELTCAGRHALEPPVINIFGADTSAVLKPSTARSATTGSAGFLEQTASGAPRCFSDRRGDG